MIGKKVWKNRRSDCQTSPKPFKSGFKVNTVKGIVMHDNTDNLAFVFEEDESQVECWRCSIAPTDPTTNRMTEDQWKNRAEHLIDIFGDKEIYVWKINFDAH